jgi:hypothetical protein
MTRSARRRWSIDLESQVDGVALDPLGPVILHVYDPPAGGKWVEDVIPGKVGAYHRQTGDRLWSSPCEVGYGRGFGAGFGSEGELVILGPSQLGHRITRMSAVDGVLLGVESIPEFDLALVTPDLCLCMGPKLITAVLTSPMIEAWRFQREGYRFHRIARSGDELFVSFSRKQSRHQGVLSIDASNGRLIKEVLAPDQPEILGLCAAEHAFALVVKDLESALPPDLARDFALRKLAASDDLDDPPSSTGTPGLLVFGTDGSGVPLWFEDLGTGPGREDPGEASVAIDSGKLYVARGALLSVRDQLSGRLLGELVVPGLDEFVSWTVCNGAFLVAEETRASVFEVPD